MKLEKYQKFIELVKEIYSLGSAQALLGWDQQTMMPPRGAQGRAGALAALAKVIQQKYCAPELGELINELEGRKDLSEEEAANIRETKRDREKLLKIPVKLTEELASTTSLAQQVWIKARPNSDVKLFDPWLEKIFYLSKQLAECLGYRQSPYDALLDQYEPESTSAELNVLLEDLREKIIPLLQKIAYSSMEPDKNLLSQAFPVSLQKKFNDMILRDMAFNLEAGRLDESAHPFTDGIWPGDVRLTTRYRDNDIMSSVFSAIHEAGHGLYEQGFLPQHYGTPLAEAVSLGIHESQSRLWENQVGRSMPFWRHYFAKLKKICPNQLKTTSLSSFYLALNAVQPSLIRVEADEVSYNLHVILRFEIEKALCGGELQVEDIEGAWNENMKRLLGITPDTARNGYMQDVHWSAGLIGYFPTYSLGNLYSAQFYHKAGRDIGDLEKKIEKGDFLPLREWLQVNIYRHGRKYRPAELVEKATGQPPTARYFVDYLTGKYSELYKL